MTRVAILVCVLAGSAAAAPCPRGAALVRAANAAFPPAVRTQGDDSVMAIDPAHLTCTVVRAPKPLALFAFDTGDGLLVALLARNAAIWEDGIVSADSLRNTIEAAETVDLDGDGVDELLLVSRHDGHERSGDTTLSVLEPAGTVDDPVSELGSITIGSRNGTMPLTDGGSSCEASWTLVRGPHRTKRIVTDGGCRGTRPDDFPIGRHTYVLRGGGLVEVGAR